MLVFLSWLTLKPQSDQNSKQRTLSRSQIHVCRYAFMAGSRHKHFLQIFIQTTLPEMVAGTFFTVPQCLSPADSSGRSSHRQSVCFPTPPGLTLLQQHGHSPPMLLFCFVAPPQRWWADWFAGRPCFLRAGHSQRQDGMTTACQNAGFAGG